MQHSEIQSLTHAASALAVNLALWSLPSLGSNWTGLVRWREKLRAAKQAGLIAKFPCGRKPGPTRHQRELAAAEREAGEGAGDLVRRHCLIPTNPDFCCHSMRERTGNLSEWALNLLVWPKTLNQRVQGSSPCAPTNEIN